jgi:hypothetical protein
MAMPKPSSSPRKIRVDPVQASLERLAEAQAGTQAELRALAGEVRHLAEAQRRTEAHLEELADAQRRTERNLNSLAGIVRNLLGSDLERKYRDNAHAYFGALLRDIHIVPPNDLARLLDTAVDQGAISFDSRTDTLYADVVARGARRTDRADAYLVAEVSASVNETDVARAQRRAAIVTRVTSLPVLAVVAGQSIRLDADEAARAAGLWRVVNGVTLAPSDAVPPERLTRES